MTPHDNPLLLSTLERLDANIEAIREDVKNHRSESVDRAQKTDLKLTLMAANISTVKEQVGKNEKLAADVHKRVVDHDKVLQPIRRARRGIFWAMGLVVVGVGASAVDEVKDAVAAVKTWMFGA